MTSVLLTISSLSYCSALDATPPTSLSDTVGWLVPAEGDDAIARFGHKDGISVIVPAYGCPRGLIGIYTPYLDLPEFQPINFVSIEPVIDGHRSYSEMEQSTLDGVQGLRLWTTDEIDRDAKPTTRPAKGKFETIGGVQTLSFYVHIERMNNGAQPIIKIIFRADKPHEVDFEIYAANGSAKMDSCILSSTCGNYARLRLLRLKSETANSTKLWEGEPTPDYGFLSNHEWPLSDLIMEDNAAVVCAQPNETDPLAAEYDTKVPRFWEYKGKVATQYWRCPNPSPKLICRVNARETYYGQPGATIPGGRAYENFELEAPFAEGQTFCFGVTPLDPAKKP